MTLHAPSYAGGFASPERGLIDRSLWAGVVFAGCPSLGATGAQLRDQSGLHNHGTLTNFTLADAWADPVALKFDGSNDHVVIPPPAITSGSITVSLMVKWDSFAEDTTGRTVFTSIPFVTSGVAIYKASTAPYNRFRYLVDAGTLAVGNSTATLSVDTWYHAAMTYDGATVKFYIDGELDSTIAEVGTLDWGSVTSIQVGSDGTSYFPGSADYISIHDRALPATQVAELYRIGPGGIYRRQQSYSMKAPAAAGRINSLVGVGGGMIGYGGGMIGRGY